MEKLFYFTLPCIAYVAMSFMAWDFTWLWQSPMEEPASFIGRFVLVASFFVAIVGYDEVSRK